MPNYRHLLAFLLLLGLASPLFQANAAWWGTKSMFKELENINQSPFTYTCGETQYKSDSCPYMFQQMQRDKESGFLAEALNDPARQATWKKCQKTIKNRTRLGNEELEKRFASNPELSIGLKNDYFSEQMNRCHNSSVYSDTDVDMNEHEQKTIIANSYSHLNRLHKHTKNLFMGTVNTNSLLGNDPLNDVPCDQFSMPKNAKLCRQMEKRECGTQEKGVEELGQKLKENAILPSLSLQLKEKRLSEKIEQLENKLSAARDAFGGNKEKRSSAREKLEDLKTELKKTRKTESTLKASYPFVQGEHMQEFMGKTLQDLEQEEKRIEGRQNSPATQEQLLNAAVEKIEENKLSKATENQLKANKKASLEKIEDNISLNKCLVYGHESHCENFSERMRDVPRTEDRALTYSGKDYKEHIADAENPEAERERVKEESLYYSNAQCFNNFREIKQGASQLLTDTTLGIGLTAFTFGSGALVSLASNAGKIGRAVGSAINLSKVKRTGQGALKLSLAGDAAYFGQGVSESLNTCQNSLDKLVETGPKEEKSVQCPSPATSPQAKTVSDVKTCAVSALASSLDVLPFTPAVLRKSFNAGKSSKVTQNGPSSNPSSGNSPTLKVSSGGNKSGSGGTGNASKRTTQEPPVTIDNDSGRIIEDTPRLPAPSSRSVATQKTSPQLKLNSNTGPPPALPRSARDSNSHLDMALWGSLFLSAGVAEYAREDDNQNEDHVQDQDDEVVTPPPEPTIDDPSPTPAATPEENDGLTPASSPSADSPDSLQDEAQDSSNNEEESGNNADDETQQSSEDDQQDSAEEEEDDDDASSGEEDGDNEDEKDDQERGPDAKLPPPLPDKARQMNYDVPGGRPLVPPQPPFKQPYNDVMLLKGFP